MNQKEFSAPSGFTLLSTENVGEIDADAYLMRHDATKARVLFLRNSDENKTFSIAFRTPPQDDTGVFHILEHSVLCGSDAYPLKEPFVNLLKTSMQTFLNAMTFPDKTMYPVASTNDQDLLNLSSVYLDAVFHPAIYDKRSIFQQEGWHYERAGQDGLSYNGVVFNEMKGALSEPESVLHNALCAALFPDTAYAFESGGDPASIPNLSYEQFLAEHQRHYCPENSYIILYGNIDYPPLFHLIDESLNNANAATPEDPPRAITTQKPLVSLDNTVRMAISQENACCAVGYVLGDACDFVRLNAAEILVDALAGSNEAPLKRALLDEGLADDVDVSLIDGIAQPFVRAQLTGIQPDCTARFKELLEKHVRELVETGIDADLIEAALSHAEFVLREHDFGYPDGVVNAMVSLAGWLYDEDCPVESLRYENTFATLRAHLADGFFERLAREIFLENDHVASAEIVVDADVELLEQQRLAKTAETLDDKDFEAIDEQLAALRLDQETPDSLEALEKLPQLLISDIGAGNTWPSYELDEQAPVACLRHHVETHGIAYMQQYYSIKGLSFDDVPYAALLAFLLGKLGTSLHSAAEIDTYVQSKMGVLRFLPKVVAKDDDVNEYSAFLAIDASALDTKVTESVCLINEIKEHTDFSDVARIKDILTQLRVHLEQSFISNGHSVALGRVGSYLRPSGIVAQYMSGIDFYLFLKDLLANFEERAMMLQEKLHALAPLIFQPDNLLASFAGTDAAYDIYLASLATGGSGARDDVLVVPPASIKHEAFVVPGDVTFTSLGYDRRLLENALPYLGTQIIAANAASLDYLWNEVRVKGGAYGCGLKVPAVNDIVFYSYRDPRIDETLERFRATAQWMRDFAPDARAFEGYVVSSVASLDNPVKARQIIASQNNAFLQGRDAQFRTTTREQALHCNVDDVRAFADTLDAAASSDCYCTIGNKSVIEKSSTDFQVIELF